MDVKMSVWALAETLVNIVCS